jgi:hypothetical protein
MRESSTLLQQAPLVGVHMGLWPFITGGKSAAFMEGQLQALGYGAMEQFIESPPSSERSRLFRRSGRLLALGALHALLVTQCATCQIAALYMHWWCRMRKGLTSTASQVACAPN